MKVVELNEAEQQLGAWAKKARGEPVLITKKGKPWMFLTDASIYDAEDVAYMTDPKFWEMIDRARRQPSTTSMAEVRRKYGLPAKPAPKRKRASAARRRITVKSARKQKRRVSDAEIEAIARTTWELVPRRARLVGDPPSRES